MQVASRPAPNRPGRQTCSSTPSDSTPCSRVGSAARRCASTARASHRVCQSTSSRRASVATVRVVLGQRVRGPDDRPAGQQRTGRRQGMGLGERDDRAGRLVTAPHPLAPAHQHPAVPERGVVQQLLTPVVQPGQHPAAVAPLDGLVGLDRQSQAAVVALGEEHADPCDPEHHRRSRAALSTVSHVEALNLIRCLVASDLRGPRPRSAGTHRRRVTCHHAQVRSPGNGDRRAPAVIAVHDGHWPEGRNCSEQTGGRTCCASAAGCSTRCAAGRHHGECWSPGRLATRVPGASGQEYPRPLAGIPHGSGRARPDRPARRRRRNGGRSCGPRRPAPPPSAAPPPTVRPAAPHVLRSYAPPGTPPDRSTLDVK